MLFALGINAFSSNEVSKPESEKKSENIIAYEVQDCPETVTNDIDGSTTRTVCEGDVINFTGSISPATDSTIQWEYDTGGGWTEVTGATSVDYTTEPLTQDISFRRVITYKGCDMTYPSLQTITVTVNSVPDPPTVDVEGATCGAAGSASITNYSSDYTYSFSPTGPTVDNNGDINNFNTAQAYTVTATNLCNSAPSAQFTVNDALNTPTTPILSITQPTCQTATGTITITSPTGTGLTYSINGTDYQVDATFTEVDPDTYNVTVKNADGCASSSISAVINNPPSAPSQPVLSLTQPTCQTATGTITITSPTGTGLTYSINGTDYQVDATFTEVDPDTYNVIVKNADGCTSSSTSAVINNPPSAPSQPVLSLTQPTCQTATGTITITSPTGTGLTYSINGTDYQVDATFSEVDLGTYNVTVKNADGCASSSTSAVINNPPSAPSQPVLSLTQPTCQTATGTITITSPTGTGLTYSINGTDYQVETTFSEVDPDTYNVTVKNADGCTSSSTSAVINNPPSAPSQPVLSLTQPTCQTATGTITITSPTGTGLTYSINGTDYQVDATFSEVDPGTYNVTVKNADGCASSSTSAVINNPPSAPSQPVLSITQPTCQTTTGTINITSPTGTGLTYSINGTDYQVETTFSEVDPGTYNLTVKNADGCTSLSTSAVINNPPSAPSQPVLSLTQPTCQTATGTITITSPTGTGLTYSINGTNYQSGRTFSGINAGNYNVTVKNSAGCISSTTAVINQQPTTPAKPNVDVTNATCTNPGSANILNYNNAYTYIFTPSGPNVNSSGKISGFTAGQSYTVSANTSQCTSPQSDQFTINTAIGAPNPPTINVSNECGQSVLTASNYSGSLLWSTSETTESITVYDSEVYTLEQTVNGCISNAASVTPSPKPVPTVSATKTDPSACNQPGKIEFTFTSVPDGTYTISYDGGTFPNVSVSGNSASVDANTGTYNNLRISVDGCTSVNGISVTINNPAPPSAPQISVSNECGQSVLTATNYEQNASLYWSTGATTPTITVNTGGEYTLKQTVGGCESNEALATAAPEAVPTLSVEENDPATCGSQGSLEFTFTNVPDNGILPINLVPYTVEYDGGSFGGVWVTNGKATVSAASGTYSNLRITVDGCTSPNGITASLSAPNAPAAPDFTVTNNCGETVLTATDYENGATLHWSTGPDDDGKTSIVVTEAKDYSLTQEIAQCESKATTKTAQPKPIPAAPDFSVTNNCDGTSILTAVEYVEGATLQWSTGETTNTITVSEEGDYSLKQIMNGCESGLTTKTAEPKTGPTMTVFKNNPASCGTLGSIDFVFTDVPNGTYTILYDEGSFENVTVTENIASVPASVGTYSNLAIDLNECISGSGINVTLTEPNAPETPNIIVDNRCGESVLTATNLEENALLRWSTGATSQTITVETAGNYSVRQTVSGCTSTPKTATAAPKSSPDTPDFSVTNNCDGTSTLEATDYNNNATLEWSTSETASSIVVTTAGEYSLTQNLSGCSSNAVTKEAAPRTPPTINATGVNPENCGEEGMISFSFTGVPNGTYDILYDNGSFTGINVTGNNASVNTKVGTYNNLQIMVNECNSAEGVNVRISEPNAPPTPTITVENDCDESVLTVSGYDESASLLWNTGETTPVLTVSEPGTYQVTQNINGCTSDAASAVAEPKIAAGQANISSLDECGESIIKMNNLPTNTWFVWEYNGVTDSTKLDSIVVTEPGDYTVYQKIDQCLGTDTTISVNPMEVPDTPISRGDVLVCLEENSLSIIAEATIADTNNVLVWYDANTGGNEVESPVLDSFGTVTYYAEAVNPNTGCTSLSRTPVKLTILQSATSLILDTAIIAKPTRSVAVLIFPENAETYQWFMNDSAIAGATNQYYYIPEPERNSQNKFSIEVQIANGCRALFSYSYSDILSSATLTGTNNFKSAQTPTFKIYPNPANQKVYISPDVSLLINEPKLRGKIFSVNGTCVYEFGLNNAVESIDTRIFNPGMYSVVLYGEDNTFYSKKLIISH